MEEAHCSNLVLKKTPSTKIHLFPFFCEKAVKLPFKSTFVTFCWTYFLWWVTISKYFFYSSVSVFQIQLNLHVVHLFNVIIQGAIKQTSGILTLITNKERLILNLFLHKIDMWCSLLRTLLARKFFVMILFSSKYLLPTKLLCVLKILRIIKVCNSLALSIGYSWN